MANAPETLWNQASSALQAGRPADAICYLAEIINAQPADRLARLTLAGALGNAGNAAGALKIMRALAERLAHDGELLPAMVVVRHGLQYAPEDPGLLQVLQRIHIRGARVKAGNVAVPPPLRPRKAPVEAASAETLLQLSPAERLTRVAELGCEFPAAGPAAAPVPLPLFCELDTPVFVEVVKRLRYNRVAAGTPLLQEGQPGDSVLIVASGKATVTKAGTPLAQLGPAAVIGEMALITRAPRSATVTADEPVEYLELARADVRELAKVQSKVADELSAYCRSRLLQNLLRTSPLFSRFDEATRLSLLGRFATATFEAGETIIAQGQAASGLYIIASGEAEVCIANEAGEMVTVAKLGPGEVFGEISLIKNQAATAYVTARNTVGALVLANAEFYRVVAEHPEVRQYLETLTADRLKASREACEASGVVDADDIIVL
jgi:CRP-like cAMP-binding protein